MKVFFYIPTLAAGGAEKQCAMTAAGLKKVYRHDVVVILDYGSSVKETNRDILADAGVRVVGLSRNAFFRFWQLWRMLRKNRDAVLFCYLTRPNFVGGLAARLARLENVFTGIRSTVLPNYKFMADKIAARFFAKGVIYNSYAANDDFPNRGFPRQKGITISNAIQIWEDLPSREETDALHVVAVGRFVPEKDYATWCKAIGRAKASGVKVKATIIGWGSEESNIRSLINELNLAEVISILPGDSDVKQTLYAANVYLSTSLFEGVSNSILEAMNAALPVVATDVGDNKHMVADGVSGYIVQIGAVDEISDRLRELAMDPKKRNRFGEINHLRVKELYSPEKMLSRYNEIIEAVAEKTAKCAKRAK